MSNIIAGNGGGRGCSATAITVALILMMVSSPAILTTTEASTASGGNEYCNGIQLSPLESSSYSTKAEDAITIETSQDEYSVDIDYFRVLDTEGYFYFKNVGADDPAGDVLLPGGETITITLQTNEQISDFSRLSHKCYSNQSQSI